MCFSQEMSAAFSVMGLAFAAWVYKTNGNGNLIQGVVYFVLMEILQVVQYMYIATDVDAAEPTLKAMQASPTCNTFPNQALTVVGLLHIAFQPYHTALLFGAFVKSEKNKAQFAVVRRLQIIGALLLIARHVGTYVDAATWKEWGVDARYTFDPQAWATHEVEWLSGPFLCTYKGLKHLAWSIPLLPVSYYTNSFGLHSFLMFVPFFAVDTGRFLMNFCNWIAGTFLFLTGPIIADWISPNKHEAGSIWCFHSIMQIVLMVALLATTQHASGKWYIKPAKDTGAKKIK